MSVLEVIILSCSMIFLSTVIGSSLVFFVKKSLSAKSSNIILGLASGVMISAGIFGLLIPAMEEAEIIYKNLAILPVVIGFILGGIFLNLLDKIVPHFHQSQNEEEGPKSNLTKQIKFFLAVLIHNIPEGLAVGFACGLALTTKTPQAISSVLALAIGISIQNVPEGAAISIPMLEHKVSKNKAFMYGVISGVVEPLFAVVGIFLATIMQSLLPWLLAFSAGAMIYVTVEELLPQARKEGHEHYGLWAFMLGFLAMLSLEILL